MAGLNERREVAVIAVRVADDDTRELGYLGRAVRAAFAWLTVRGEAVDRLLARLVPSRD